MINNQFFQSELIPITGLEREVIEIEVHLSWVIQFEIGLGFFDDFLEGESRTGEEDRLRLDLVHQ
ncbi:MAG: hypothetical protein ACO22O_12435 [bacterium]